MIIYLVLAGLGLYFILNVETMSIPLLNVRVRYFMFQDELYEVEEWMYVGAIIFVVIMIALALRSIGLSYVKLKDQRK